MSWLANIVWQQLNLFNSVEFSAGFLILEGSYCIQNSKELRIKKLTLLSPYSVSITIKTLYFTFSPNYLARQAHWGVVFFRWGRQISERLWHLPVHSESPSSWGSNPPLLGLSTSTHSMTSLWPLCQQGLTSNMIRNVFAKLSLSCLCLCFFIFKIRKILPTTRVLNTLHRSKTFNTVPGTLWGLIKVALIYINYPRQAAKKGTSHNLTSLSLFFPPFPW